MTAPFSLSQSEIDILRAALSHTKSAEEPDPLLAALDGIAQRAVGHRLFTALRYDLTAGTAHRLYSSAPDRYPASGTKLISAAPAMQNMLATGKPLLTPDANAVRINFPDADAIFALNCQSVLNIPVYGRGRLLGQINLLHAANHYTPAHTDFCAGLAVIAATAFL
ncbi:GAF domain-containing protein [Achromobacter spanius]|uniref:GAF domain-containing protein n=1 Tax=Achromobacter spanius TaxID=217203 RepID=UPI000F8F8471|nr:GAF domain-containing protein [Achromobacter spanius]AZS81455.1 GAF domain-containing protein [Achromobacter spanius]